MIELRNSYQDKSKKSYQRVRNKYQFEKDIFNTYQNKLYKSCTYGLGAYSQKELKQMSFSERLSIIGRFLKVQEILNRWKQELVSKAVNDFLSSVFYHSKSVKRLIEKSNNYTDDDLICYHSFKDLGISKLDIAKKLIQESILPKNFLNAA